MMRYLLVLSLCGLVLAQNAPEQTEEYEYKGMIKSAVLNPRQTAAGSELTITVQVQRHADQSADITFKNSQSATFNREEYSADPHRNDREKQSSNQKLDGHVKAYLNRESGTVLEADSGDELWLINFRKAFIDLLRIPAYLGDKSFFDLEHNVFHAASMKSGDSSDSFSSAFFKTEETFAGRCNVSYTMNRDFADGSWDGNDPSSSGLPSDKSKFFRLHRSVDFDSCSDPVSMQKTSYGNFSEVHKGQFLDVQSRSTVSEYLLYDRGDGFYDIRGAMRIGAQFIRPFGQDSGRVFIQSNQTLTLKSIKAGGSPHEIKAPSGSHHSSGTQQITTWKYQLRSPADPKQDTRVDWVDYQSQGPLSAVYPEYAILGRPVKSEQENLQRTNQILDDIATLQLEQNDFHKKPYNGTNDGRLAESLNMAARSIRTLSYDSIKSIHQQTLQANADKKGKVRRQSFLDASIASGSSAALKAFVDEAQAGHIDNQRQGSLFAGMVNNIYDPEAIKPLMDYVKTLEVSKSPSLSSLAHLNFAMLAQRVCTQKDTRRYAVPEPYLGSKACDSSIIENDFVPHLEEKIQNGQSVWEQLMYTQTLGTLGLESTVPFLRKVALGQVKDNLYLRMGAIHAMAHSFPEPPGRDKVEQELIALAEAHAEDFRIREAAFITLMGLRPNETVLERFAHGTWRDPSSHMQSLVSATFIALAESDSQSHQRQSHVARKFLPQIKPVQPSAENSAHFLTKTEVPDYKIDVEQTLAWLTKYRSPVAAPQQVYSALNGDFGGIVVPLMETFSMLDQKSIKSLASSMKSHKHNVHQQEIQQELNDLAAALELEKGPSTDDIYVYVSAFNYQSLLSYSSQSPGKMINSFLAQKATDEPKPFMPEQMVKYFNPVDIQSVLPTAFGVPAIVQISAPNNWMWDCNYTLRFEQDNAGHSIGNLTLTGLSKMTVKTQSLMSVLLPWQDKQATAGFDTEATISLPGKMSVKFNNTYPFTQLKQDISPDFRGEKPVLYWRSKPLSTVRSMDPTSDLTAEQDLITPVANKSSSYNRTIDVPMSLLGLKAKINYQGDVDYPFQQSNIIDYLRYPERMVTLLTTPTPRDAALYYSLNMDQSQTKNISFALVTDFGFLDMEPLPYPDPDDDIGQRIARNMSVKVSPEGKVTQGQNREIGDFMISLSVNYTTPNVRTRQFEVALSGSNITKSGDSDLRQTLVLNLMRQSPSSGRKDSQGEEKVCLITNLREQRPCTKQQSKVYTTATTDIYAGSQCSDNEKIGSVKTEMYLSQDEKDSEPRPLSSTGVCTDKITDPASQTPWKQDAIYDRLNLELNYQKDLPSFYRNLSNWMQDMSEGYVFPHAVKNRDPGSNKPPKDSLILNVTRNVASGVVDAWAHSSDSIVEVQNFNVWPVFDWISPILGPRIPYQHHFDSNRVRGILSAFGSEFKCTINPEEVTTFDGVKYAKDPSTCWIVATKVYHEDETLTVLYHQTSNSHDAAAEVKILARGVPKIEILRGVEIKMDGNSVTNFPSDIKSPSGEVIGQLSMSAEGPLVEVHGRFSPQWVSVATSTLIPLRISRVRARQSSPPTRGSSSLPPGLLSLKHARRAPSRPSFSRCISTKTPLTSPTSRGLAEHHRIRSGLHGPSVLVYTALQVWSTRPFSSGLHSPSVLVYTALQFWSTQPFSGFPALRFAWSVFLESATRGKKTASAYMRGDPTSQFSVQLTVVMGCTSLLIIWSLAAMSLTTAMPYDPSEDYIDRSLFRDQRFFTKGLASSHSSGFFPSTAGGFFGPKNIVATPHVLRSSVAAQVPLLTLAPCPKGLARNAAGRCVKPVLLKNVFLFKAPFVNAPKVPVPKIPKPKILYNYVYVNSADSVKSPKPIVVPPPQEKTLVYVLNKRPEPIRQEVIEVPPHQDTDPEVFFINYNEGQNQQLPGGVDLQTVLSQQAGQQAVSIGGSDLALFAESSAAGAFGGQVAHIGAFSDGSDFDFSDEIFEDGISSIGPIDGLSGYNFPSSARSFDVPVGSPSAVQRLIPTISSGGSALTSSILDQKGGYSTFTDVSLRNEIVNEDGIDGETEEDGSDSSSGEESFEGDSEDSHEKRSTKVIQKLIVPSSTSLKSAVLSKSAVRSKSATPPKSAVPSKFAGLQKSLSKQGKSVVIALVKSPSLKPKITEEDDMTSSPSEAVAVHKSVSGDDALTIPVLTSEDVQKLLEKSEPKEDS
ncbi:Vitellinogen open beta-sheet [Trinorchestia longiramus]|nr:Vitellinogen open beta-sheet [Trinorchestia longiramus]